MTVSPIRPIERRQIHLPHGVHHKPRQMIRRQPIPHVRRQQKPLLTTTLKEVLRHTEIVLNVPDGTSFVRQPLVIAEVSDRLAMLSALAGADLFGPVPGLRLSGDGCLRRPGWTDARRLTRRSRRQVRPTARFQLVLRGSHVSNRAV